MSKANSPVMAKAYTHYRDYIKENKYLGGLIKASHLVKTDRLSDEVVLVVPKGTKVSIVETDI